MKYTVDPSSIIFENSVCKMDVVKADSGAVLTVELYALEDNTFRVKITEKSPMHPCYEVDGVLFKELKQRE